MKNFALRVSGDIKIELSQKTNKKKILHFWFNTYFVYESAVLEGEGENAKLVYTLNKCEIDDAHKDKEHKLFSDDFKVQLAFYNESSESTEYNRSNDNHQQHRTYPAATSILPVMRGTATTIACESSNSSNSEMHIICDQEQASGTGTGTYENIIDTTIKNPYGNHHHHHETTNKIILTERRPTSLIAVKNDNNSPHKLQKPQHRRSDVLLNNMTTTTTTIPTPTGTSSSSNCSNNQRQQTQQQQLLQMKHNTTNSNNSNNHHNNHIQMATKTIMKSINNQSNISNSSNSSINSHITSVSSSASMASTSGGMIGGGKHQQDILMNNFNEKLEDNDDDDDDEDVDVDVDDEDDDADREDNEEDWESGESAVNKPLPTTSTTTTTTNTTTSSIRNNEKQLVTNISTTNFTTLSITTTKATVPHTATYYDSKKLIDKKQHQMQQNSSGSSTSSKNYFNQIGDIVHFYNDNGNKVHIDNNYDVDDDDDDGDDYDDNVVDGINNDDDNNEIQQQIMDEKTVTNNYTNNNCDCITTTTGAAAAVTETKRTTQKDVEAELLQEDAAAATTTAANQRSNSCTNNNNNYNNNNNTNTNTNNNSNKQFMSNLAARYKIMHLLTAKPSNKVMAPRHSYFKRKSLKSKQPQPLSTQLMQDEETTTTKKSNCLTTNECYVLAGAVGGSGDCVDGIDVEELRTRTTSVGNSGGCGGGVGGGLAKASKLKLKLGLSKTNSKLKWTQKFHWLQNYVRSADAVADLRKTLAQTTTTTTSTSSQRLNSNSSATNCNGIKRTITNDVMMKNNSLEKKSIITTTTTTIMPSRNITPPQIVGIEKNNCTEDYYSSICDNQLSFNNSPCKSPRSLIDKHKQQNKNGDLTLCTPHLRTSKKTMSTSVCDDTLKIVVVAARPANIGAIGFNVATTTTTSTAEASSAIISSVAEATATLALGTCNITNGSGGSGSTSSSGYATASTLHSDSSIYSTPPTSVLEHKDILNVDNYNQHDNAELLVDTTKISPFIFPNISAEITELAHVLKATNIDQSTTTIIKTNIKPISKTLLKNGNIRQQNDHDEHNNERA